MGKHQVLILGNGIAGLLLAWTLFRKNVPFKIARGKLDSSSNKAAGLINPITGRRWAKTWKADTIFPFAHSFYKSIERDLGISFFEPYPIFRTTTQESDLKFPEERLGEREYEDWLKGPEKLSGPGLSNREWFKILRGGFIRTQILIEGLVAFFESQNLFIDSREHNFVELLQTPANENFSHRILCTGAHPLPDALLNPLKWQSIFRPNKGHILKVKITNFKPEGIFMRSQFLIPQGQEIFLFGSNYDWDFEDKGLEPKIVEMLMEKLNTWELGEVQCLDAWTGIRPSSADRRPIVGQLNGPLFKNVYFFGGFGSKGFSLAPWVADTFFKYLFEDTALPKSIDLQRFY